MIQLSQYQALALRTEAPLPSVFARLEHAALGLISESGEIATQVKRIAIYGKTLDSLDKDKTLRAHIVEESGDTMWYMAVAGDVIGKDVFRGLMGDLKPRHVTLSSAMLRLAGVVGKFARYVEYDLDSAAYLHDGDHATITNYLHDMAQALVDIAAIVGVPIEEIAAENIVKLTVRFPNAFTAEAAEARADKGGLDARNS